MLLTWSGDYFFECSINKQKKTRQSKAIKRGDNCPVLLHATNETVDICAFSEVFINGDAVDFNSGNSCKCRFFPVILVEVALKILS